MPGAPPPPTPHPTHPFTLLCALPLQVEKGRILDACGVLHAARDGGSSSVVKGTANLHVAVANGDWCVSSLLLNAKASPNYRPR